MNQSFNPEKQFTPEISENQRYKELLASTDEENRIMNQITEILTKHPNRTEAEKIVLEKYAPLMDKAMKKSQLLLQDWLKIMTENAQDERKNT